MGLFAFRRDYVRTVEAYAADAATSKADQRKKPSFGNADKSAIPAPAAAEQSESKKDAGNCPMPEPKPVGEEPKAKRGRPKKSST